METIIIKEELLPDMRDISEYFVFQQDSAPAHRAKQWRFYVGARGAQAPPNLAQAPPKFFHGYLGLTFHMSIVHQ